VHVGQVVEGRRAKDGDDARHEPGDADREHAAQERKKQALGENRASVPVTPLAKRHRARCGRKSGESRAVKA
jgi:hypothetical protein